MPFPDRDPKLLPRREPLPSGPPGWLANFIISLGVIGLSFWITLLALDSWVFNQGASRPPRLVFSLDRPQRHWAVVNSKTQTTVGEKEIVLGSKADLNEYQWLTDPIAVDPNADFTLSYKIEVTEGRMGIGVLDFVTNRWIVTKEITTQSDTIAFKAPSAQLQVILFGTSAPPTGATLSQLTITRP
jgi:hypothetical protein